MLNKLARALSLTLLCSGTFLSPAVAADEKPVLHYLSADDVNPVQLLAPPPADGTAEQKAGVAEVLAIAKGATPARMEKATWDDRHESAVIWERIIGPSFSLKDLPATKAALDEMQAESDAAADFAKVYFNRLRPWNFDKNIPLCSEMGRAATPRRSTPSGHATMAFTQAMLLTKLMPAKADAILLGAQDYAFSRVVCGTHYTSDLPTSETLGTVVGTLMLRNDAFKPKVEAARAELIAAGLATK